MDLREKILGVNGIESDDENGLRNVLGKRGMDPERKVQVLALGGRPNRWNAL